MRIRQIEIYKLPVKLKSPFVISLETLRYAENIIVVIHTDNGIKGFGECSPFKTINGESMDTCFIVGQYLAGALVGKDPLQLEKCIHMMDKVIYANHSIKSAFDMALHDIVSQHVQLPLYKFLGGTINQTLETDFTVSLGESNKMASDAVEIISNGFNIVKVKLGESKNKDVERIHHIRIAIGNRPLLRIDANQGWEADEAIDILKALTPYHIQFCEEPIARWNYIRLPEIKAKSQIPVMADESCCDIHDAQRLIELKACDSVNVKLGKSGGLYNASKIISIVANANLKIQIGGFLESRLGFTAAAHLALTNNQIQFIDFDTPLMFEEDYVSGGIHYTSGGKISVPDSAGLGAFVNEDILTSLEKVVFSAQ